MRLPEQRVWDTLKRRMPEDFLPQRHEDKYSSGIPDLSFVWRGVSGWIELKSASPAIHIRPAQAAWMLKRTRAGVPCILLARHQLLWAGVRVDTSTDFAQFTSFKSLGESTLNPVVLLESLIF